MNVISLNQHVVNNELPQLDKLAFKAEKVPFMAITGNVEWQGKRAVVRRDQEGLASGQLGIVGSEYTIAQNEHLRAQLQAAFEHCLDYGVINNRNFLKGATLKETTSRNGAFSKMTFSFPQAAARIRQVRQAFSQTMPNDTELNFQVSIVNTFDGSKPVMAYTGAIDLICTNGMMGLSIDQFSKRKHTAGLDLGYLVPMLEQGIRDYQERVGIWQLWAERKLTPEQAESTLKANGVAARLTKNLMEQYEQEARDRGQTVWAFYSALTYYASHNKDSFTVRNTGADNVADTLQQRAATVHNITQSNAWIHMVRDAA